jgi:hypothetical protein
LEGVELSKKFIRVDASEDDGAATRIWMATSAVARNEIRSGRSTNIIQPEAVQAPADEPLLHHQVWEIGVGAQRARGFIGVEADAHDADIDLLGLGGYGKRGILDYVASDGDVVGDVITYHPRAWCRVFDAESFFKDNGGCAGFTGII